MVKCDFANEGVRIKYMGYPPGKSFIVLNSWSRSLSAVYPRPIPSPPEGVC